MGCRCTDIANYNNDIAKLKDSIKSELEDAETYNDRITTKLKVASKAFDDAIYTGNLSNTDELLSKINNAADTNVPALVTACTNEVTRLQGLLTPAQSEDYTHHNPPPPPDDDDA